MRIVASAPGKLVLLGEYAVLEGAPALVLAVDRRVRVTLTPGADAAWTIASPTLALEARLTLRDGRATWEHASAAELAWVGALFAGFAPANRIAPCRIELASDALYLEDAGARAKLGLGSSAALTVALLGALHAAAGLPPPTLDEAIRAHRATQHGRGSGIDAAASLLGGLLRFQLDDDTPRVAAAALPDHLHWCCAYSGRPASTAALLAQAAAWRARAPADFARHMRELATISSRGIDAVAANDAHAFTLQLHGYAQALARFGESAGMDIASRAHRALGALAAACGCVYKSCGAGGGDVGITFAAEDTQLQAFRARAAQAGYRVIDLQADRQGLVVATNA